MQRPAANLSLEDYAAGVRAGDRAMLARAITLVESTKPAHAALARSRLICDEGIVDCRLESIRESLDFREGQVRQQIATYRGSLLDDGVGNAAQCVTGIPTVCAKVRHEDWQHVQLADRTQSTPQFLQLPFELARCRRFEFQQRQSFSEAAQGHAGPVQCPRIGIVNSYGLSRENGRRAPNGPVPALLPHR